MINPEIHHNDHDKLIRLEAAVEHLSKDVSCLSEIIDKHIEQDRETFRQIFEEMSKNGKQTSNLTNEMKNVCSLMQANSESVKDLTKKQTYALGFIAGTIAFGGVAWTVIEFILPLIGG